MRLSSRTGWRQLAGKQFDRAIATRRKSIVNLLIVLLALTAQGYGIDLHHKTVAKHLLTASPVDFVDPYIGTGGGGHEYGGTMPFVTTPFAMTSWTPQTRQNRVSVTSYAYEDQTISGFIGTHQPAIWMGDYGYVTLMPELNTLKITPDERKQSFSRKNEIVTPYYYSVVTDAGNSQRIRTEMTATNHCGLLRFTYPEHSRPLVMVEGTRKGIAGFIRIDPRLHQVVGYNPDRMDSHLGLFALSHFKGYFVIEFDRPFTGYGTYHDSTVEPESLSVTNTNVGAYVKFGSDLNHPVEVKIGTSLIGIDRARANLHAEIPDWNFNEHREELKSIWNHKLGIAMIDGATKDQRTIFYTGLYHALLYPRDISEYGRYYSAFDDRVHSGSSYTDYSLWDTYRAENSLTTIFAPERENGMVQALLQDYQQGGWMPKWPNPFYTNIMVGTPADSIVAEAIHKGFHGFSYALAYQAAYKDAMTPPDGDTTRRWSDREPDTPYEARAGLTYSKRLGYIPVDKTAEAASSSLEEDYEDWDVAQVAKAVGNLRDYAFFYNRSMNYKLLFNHATGFMQGRNSDGSWASANAGWTEGDKWVYTWSVLHDIPGLVALMGGPGPFNAKLDEHFNGGHNRHDNEPSHHTGYLYDYSGAPWKTQFRVRQIAAKYYSSNPDGITGNEDCGQMSAWYIFTALGFYPVNPASGNYMIGSPLFEQTTLNLPNGHTFRVVADHNSTSNLYIQSATLDGVPLNIPVITYSQIEAGGTLKFIMGPKPSSWAANWHPEPLSKISGSAYVHNAD